MSNFETWWEREGQEFLYALNTTTDDDIKLVAEVAWKNGAYCAEQAEQEPVAWGMVLDGEVNDCIGPTEHARCEGDYTIALYAAPVRTKDLTDDEQLELARSSVGKSRHWLVAAVIAAYKEKNK